MTRGGGLGKGHWRRDDAWTVSLWEGPALTANLGHQAVPVSKHLSHFLPPLFQRPQGIIAVTREYPSRCDKEARSVNDLPKAQSGSLLFI